MSQLSSDMLLSKLETLLDPASRASLAADTLETSSLRSTGILKRGIHLTDLVLLAPTPHRSAETSLFLLAARYLIHALDSGKMAVLNEKIDGSPAIVVGKDASDVPFIAYKGGIERATGAQLLRTPSDAARFFPRSPALKTLMEEAATLLLPRIPSCVPPNHCIQGDLLFTPSNGARQKSEHGVTIRANPSGITYSLTPDSRFFGAASSAPLGIVLHTPALLQTTDEGLITSKPIHDRNFVLDVSQALCQAGLFSCHPFHFNVPLDAEAWAARRSEALATLEKVERLLRQVSENLSEEFSKEWLALAPKLSVFFNKDLYPPGKGGIYRAAQQGEEFDFDHLRKGFERWIWLRRLASPKAGNLISEGGEKSVERLFSKESQTLLEAYFHANRFFYLIRPPLEPAFKSKLGGGPSEGFMVGGGSVKVVDRLQFTMANFSRPHRVNGATRKLRYPFNTWRPGARFILVKFQPPHVGHAGLIRAAIQAANGQPVFLLASRRQRRLSAKTWKDLNVTQTKGELQTKDFTHPFSRSLRRQLLEHMANGAKIVMLDPKEFFLYLAWAREQGHEGKVKLVVGEKEVAAGRYASQLLLFGSHLELEAVPLEAGGLRAKEVRAAIARASLGDEAAREEIRIALSYVSSEAEREQIIDRLLSEWRQVEQAAERMLRKKRRNRKK